MNRAGLGRWQATALALSFVVGSGILVLPVLSLELAGPAGSLQAWMLMTLIGIPLVSVFHKLANYQNVSLVESFTRTFGPFAKRAAELTVLGALLFGMPAMIYTTAKITLSLSVSEVTENLWVTGLLSHAILTLLCLNHLRPLQKSSRVSIYSSVFLGVLIMFISFTHRKDVGSGLQLALETPIGFNLSFLKTCALTFFGYVGWESLGFFAGELKHPNRDLKWVFGLSFALVSVGYLSLSAAISGLAARGVSLNRGAGILMLLPSGPVKLGASLVVVLILLANLNAWVFGGRKQFSNFLKKPRPGSWPDIFEKRSLLVYYATISSVLFLLESGKLSVSDLFLLSNQHWIVIYGGVIAYYFKTSRTRLDRLIGILALASFGLLLMGCTRWIFANGAVFLYYYFKEGRGAERELDKITHGVVFLG